MFKVFTILLSFLFMFSSCSQSYEKQLKVSVNAWIGYAPLFYAYDKGWLDEYNIKILNVVSLAESMSIYDSKSSDAFSGTQYEYTLAKTKYKTLTPIMLFDKSNGGDMVMGNFPIETYQSSKEKVEVYLEIDSVNSLILQDFLHYYKLDNILLHYNNMDQESISILKNSDKNIKKLIVTYSPYDTELKKSGFKTLASTKDELSITVLDALFTTQKTFSAHQKQFKALKLQTDRAIELLHRDPKEFYNHVRHYLQDISYEEFEATLDDIKWINKELSPTLLQQIEKIAFPVDGLI